MATKEFEEIPRDSDTTHVKITELWTEYSLCCTPKISFTTDPFWSPIPFGLGVELDHVFGSKWLIEELFRLGF